MNRLKLEEILMEDL